MSASLNRIHALDTVRGVAVLGILLLNIVAFGMPTAAYFNPRAYGGWHGIDLAVYLVNFILFDGKMRGLFSFLFGASMLLVIERAEAGGRSPARAHYSRMIWLLAFGLAHLWLVWDGDILGLYAVIGMVAFACRGMAPHRMVALGVMLLFYELFVLGSFPAAVLAGPAVPGSPDAAAAAQSLLELQRGFGVPSPGDIHWELALHRGGYAPQLAFRLHENPTGPLTAVAYFGAETLAYMLFGMAALRSELLRGTWDRARYRRWMAWGFGIGLPCYAALAAYMVVSRFSLFSVTLAAMALATLARPAMILGWACLILLLARPGGALTERLSAAGRMAFTNYLATSLICTTFFYGYGFGWFGYLSRAELYLVVLALWAGMLLWSKPWLARFRYGPFEWVWRSLARGRPQPMRGAAGI